MQSRFNNLSYTLLEMDELTPLIEDIHNELQSKFPEEPFLSVHAPKIDHKLTMIKQLKSRTFNNEFTELSHKSDKIRDKLYSIIRTSLKNDIALADIDERAAEVAGAVLKVFDQHPVDVRAGYNAQSAQLEELFSALDPIEDKVFRTTASKRISLLRKEQKKFDEIRLQHAVEQKDALKGELLPEVKELMFQLNGVLSYLELQAMHQEGQYESSAALIEEFIENTMTPARARKTKEEN